ncbi:MAG: dihydrodipicolinate reductase [Novosphingobium sp.]|nr:dihydrodipicolinate reductase [Novosphingobium sp.]
MKQRPLRVAQWGTGNVGLYALRSIIEDPKFELVGVRVYSDEKVGRDAGELCGLPPVGVTATQDPEAILAARPDCVVYMPERAEFDVLARLLAAGINVATSRMEFNGRERIEPAVRRQLEQACATGGASLYASGSTPGWFTEVMPLVLSALERRFDCLTITDYADMESRNSPQMLFEVLPFGSYPEAIDANAPVGTATSTPPSLSMTAAALGLPLDELVTAREFALTRQRTEIAAGTLEPGTIGAMRMEITGLHRGKPILRRRSIWYVTRDVEPAWDLRDTGIHYRVDGDLPLEVMFTIPVAEQDYPKVSPALTANPVLNAVPYVCAAPPGLLQTDELPLIVGRFGAHATGD